MCVLCNLNGYQDERGRYADFHALRHTSATFMRKHGISDSFAKKQMRHQTIRQTDVYTDRTQRVKTGRNLARPVRGTKLRKLLLMTWLIVVWRTVAREWKWSERRDSNPRHSPWQGDALPD
jgi:hypothetical protein